MKNANGMWTKMLSVLLVLVMVLGFVPAVSAAQEVPIVLDFMAFADTAPQQSWWSDLRDTNVAGIKALGMKYGVSPTAEYTAALKELGTWLDENVNWDIPDLYEGSNGHYNHPYAGRRIFIDGINDHYGLRFYTSYPNNGYGESKCTLTFDVPSGSEGMYGFSIESFYEAVKSIVPSCDGDDNGGATVTIYLNGEEVVTGHTFAKGDSGIDEIVTDDFGNVELQAGENTLKFWVTGNRNGVATAGRCAMNLRKITFTPAAECDHTDTSVVYDSNDNRTHQVEDTCVCGKVVSEQTVACADGDGDDLCDLCGGNTATRPAPTKSFPEDSIVMDFMSFAYDAVDQAWCQGLRPSNNQPDVRSIGVPYGTVASAEQVQAIKDLQGYLDENENWTIEDLTSGSPYYTHQYGGRQIYLDAVNDYYGVRFYTHLPGRDSDISRLKLLLTVPEGKGGIYNMDIETFDEAISSVITSHDGWDNGGATCDIYVNDVLICEDHTFAADTDSIENLILPEVMLNEGINSIVFDVLGNRNGVATAGRCALNLRYISFEPVKDKSLAGNKEFFDFTYNRYPDFAAQTMATHDIAINKELTYNQGSGLSVNSRGLQIYTPAGETFALDLRVQKPGWYRVELRGSSEVGTITAHGMMDDTYIGSIDYSKGGTNQARGGYNVMWLNAGVHTLRLVAAQSGQQVLGGVRLYGSCDPNEVSISLTAEKEELIPGQTTALTLDVETARKEDFSLLQQTAVPSFTNYCILTSSDPAVAAVSGMTVTAKKAGTAVITLQGEVNAEPVSHSVTITVKNGTVADAKLTAEHTTVKPTQAAFPLTLTTYGAYGSTVSLPTGAAVRYTSGNEAVAKVSSSGTVTVTGTEGSALITALITEGSHTVQANLWITVTAGKTENTVYTDTERANAQKNARLYRWAYTEKNNVVKKADIYVENLDFIYEQMLFPQTWPGNSLATYTTDADSLVCAYCRADLSSYGVYPYIVDPINNPWKITCPACRRDFPSNDFGAYYRSGIGSDGKFSTALADKQYLTNTLYPEMGSGWGVDDGWGWKKSSDHVYTFISHYIRKATMVLNSSNNFIDILDALRDAYLYTGDETYGNAGAILTDRLADIYTTYDISDFPITRYGDNDGYGGAGIQFGHIADGEAAIHYAKAAAAFWDCMDNEAVVNYLANRAAWKGLTAAQITPEQIRANVDDNLLLAIWAGLQTDDVSGNFGIPQAACAYTAVALDRLPETQQMIDWLFAARERGGSPTDDTAYATGGGVMTTIINQVKRDGLGAEGSLSYNSIWESDMMDMYEALDGYTRVPSADMWKNSKVVTMYHAAARLMTGRLLGPNLHETSGNYQAPGYSPNIERMTTAFIKTGDPMIARAIYAFNGNSVSGLHGDIFTSSPETGVRNQITAIVEQEGTWDMAASDMMPGYGLAMLKEGPATYTGVADAAKYSTYWMYYGDTTCDHHQREILNLDLDAFGLTLSGNMGYPLRVDSNAERLEWVENTISNNTVVVDDLGQMKVEQGGTPMHFADDGYAKVMDADVPHAYENTDIYRRTVVAVDNGDGVHYAVDFFRILGGSEHVYSFHAASMTDPVTTGLSMVRQASGTYMGENVPFGPDPSATPGTSAGSGYSWLYNVSRDGSPDAVFSADWAIKDFNGKLSNSDGIHLKLTMLSNEPMTEVAFADGQPPQNGSYPEHLEFMMVRRSGDAGMDTLFTTILEPYQNSNYIASAELVEITLTDGVQAVHDRAAAVKVTLTSGRVDYIVYTTNPDCTYRVADLFDFKGFAAVVSVENGKVTYAWGDEATILTDRITDAQPAVTGEVVSFTEGLQDSYEMTIFMDRPISAEELTGKWIYVKNDGMENGVYRIYGAEVSGNTAVIDLSFQTLIRSYLDEQDLSRGYRHNISAGDSYTIPLSVSTAYSHCDHTETTTAIGSNGDKTHTAIVICQCGEVVSEEIIPCSDEDKDTKCDACGAAFVTITKFAMAGSNMTLGNELVVNVMFMKNKVTGEGNTIEITHGDAVTTIAQADWESYNAAMYVARIPVAAKEMADDLTVTVKNADGYAISNPYTTSVREYAGKVLAGSTSTYSQEMKNLAVDMLNYGAAAQLGFSYNTEDMANKLLTAEQAGWATADVTCTNNQVKGTNCMGSNLSLESKILLNIIFRLTETAAADKYAMVTYTDYTGKAVEYRVDSFNRFNASMQGIVIDEIVLADAFQLVTVTVYNADGTVYGTGSDSVESYAARTSNDLNAAIMKFASSAKTYLSK